MEKEVTKKHPNKSLLTILLAIPILLGVILYISYCSVTPNYQWIYDNKIVNEKETTDDKYYTIGDSHDCFSSNIKKDGDVYKTSSDSKELFKVDLNKLNSFNNDYNKLIVDFSFSASIDSGKAVYTSSPKLDFVVDGSVLKTVSFSTENFASYSIRELPISNTKELVINIKTYGIASDSAIPTLNFKDLKIKVLGA